MAILAVLMLPALPGKGRKARRANCMSNLKQIGMGFMNYAIDREDNYPWNIPPEKGGVLGDARAQSAYRIYMLVSNELPDPKILVCVMDKATKKAAANWTQFDSPAYRSNALSYFIGLDARPKVVSSILAGDRNIDGTTKALCPAVNVVADELAVTNTTFRFSNEIHQQIGLLAMADSSVQTVTATGLQRVVQDIEGIETHGGKCHIVLPR